jgi:predicted dehydrogenase
MSAYRLNVAIVGCGYVAHHHAKAWRKIPRTRILAVYDTDVERARLFSRQWSIPNIYLSFEDLLRDERISVIDICTPPQTHLDLVIRAIKERKHVLVEKPLTMTVKEAHEILRQKPPDIRIGVVYNLLFEPIILKLISIVRRGDIGQIYNIRVDMLHTNQDPMLANEKHWCHRLPGGRFGEVLPHPIYLVGHFLGNDLEVKNVEAYKLGPYPWVRYDELHVLLGSQGKLGRIYVSFNSPREAIYITIIGDKGILETEVITGTIMRLKHLHAPTRYDKGKEVIKQVYQLSSSLIINAARVASHRWITGHEGYIRAFAESLTSGKELPNTIEKVLKDVEILEKICKKL